MKVEKSGKTLIGAVSVARRAPSLRAYVVVVAFKMTLGMSLSSCCGLNSCLPIDTTVAASTSGKKSGIDNVPMEALAVGGGT